MAFQVPAQPTASWPFRLLAVARNEEPYRAARRLLWLHLAVLILVPTLLMSAPAVALMSAVSSASFIAFTGSTAVGRAALKT